MSWRSQAEDAYERGGVPAVAALFGEGREDGTFAMVVVVRAPNEEQAWEAAQTGDDAVLFVGDPWPVKPTVDDDNYDTAGVIRQRV